LGNIRVRTPLGWAYPGATTDRHYALDYAQAALSTLR
jgi:hypothetical protein